MNRKRITATKLKIGIASAFMIFGSTLMSAQQQVSLQEAIKQALQNKAEAKKAALQVKKAEYKIDEARAGALPQVSATAGLTYNPIIQESLLEFGGEKIRAQFGQPWGSTASVQLQQAIFDQRVFTGLKAAKSTREFYVLNAQLTNEQIIENVATAYYQVFVQEENLKTVTASYANTEKVRNVIKSLVDNGLAKAIDLDRTNVQLTNIGSNKQALINSVELSKNALKFYMGIPISTDIELEEKQIEPKPELIASNVNLNDRTELKVLNKNRELLVFNKKATEAYLYPSVNLTANYGWGANGAKFPLTNGLSRGVLWSDFSAIGLNVNIPIFTGGATKAKINQAEIDIQDLDVDIENTQLSLSLDYKNAVTNMENALINLESMKDNVGLAERVQKNTQSNYQYGLATLTEVLDSENALTQAKQNYSNALLDYKQAEIKLIKAKGELNTLQNL
ncbi:MULTISPECIES: TolC family protein [Chryseobacterium]|uniref:TolC family protein n=1 Tax=Chryseobacterium cucumeris TaxID=1813611 RepID=A0ABX9X0W9_9FLAO|nr:MULTISPECIES: TolC family protein [Chryseobacterium]MDH5032972.1 TolC family protein [Chryseobacterium cucumeris]QWT86603.1 TolC family protein [Chryseobacterium sp. PCH239]ROH87688.1 TolC family protein [Chryseobacterium cucumeris]TXI96699.1 MAG: TolC family protein [Chryseobacterium cucumeris]